MTKFVNNQKSFQEIFETFKLDNLEITDDDDLLS